MDRFFPLLNRLRLWRRAPGLSRGRLVCHLLMGLQATGGLMLSISLWTSLDGLALGDFFMLSLVQLLLLAGTWLALHVLRLTARDCPDRLDWPALVALAGELLALAWATAGLSLLVAGFFPRPQPVFAFFAGFPFLGGIRPGVAGGILGCCLGAGGALLALVLGRTLAGRTATSAQAGAPDDSDGFDGFADDE